jgi:hypothetical protein
MAAAGGLALLLAATPMFGAGGCEDDGKNLLAKRNCGFAEDVEGWEGVETQVAHDGADGSPTRGSLAVTGTEGFVVVVGPCVKVKAGARYLVSARVRATAGTIHSCSVTGRQFSDGQCSGSRENFETGAAITPPSNEWQTVRGEATAAADAESVQLHLECTAEDALDVRFDDLVLARP